MADEKTGKVHDNDHSRRDEIKARLMTVAYVAPVILTATIITASSISVSGPRKG